ncbi:fumarylacetoacetate hydrolase family protein [Streptomyces sp. So13.3]|uniref:fumarylacetoacetate hydrolase family protein n=1 Tax=Streptomyces TaxID=1883 RepID=UPI0011068705|nr:MULTISPECIES: fumarylacetoacetate hydrolase family protein [unclassified Streptomyces]MCZ4098687.1 fumarylacetoacetate hydrolase family protein [Streptomyces sp. H39-C1]QNA76252.1 fumarylacetoacetate hydrolase family protein [Streptomyces sp. So13.3]
MKIVGVRRPQGGSGVEVATLAEGHPEVTVIASLTDFWADPVTHLSRSPVGPTLAVSSVELVPPVLPDARVFCIGLNYLDHAAEGSYRDQPLPTCPTLFARWPRSLTVDGAEVPVPANEAGLDWEGEVVAWVGAPLVDASPEEALASVVGYSAFNDLTARRAQKLTSQWILGKNADRSGPIGPMVPATEVGDLKQGLRLRTRVNGETVQDGRTDQMVYTVGDTLSLISHTLTLRPGDLLATGTPAGVGYSRTPPWLLQPGDEVEVEVERLGAVRNFIVGNDRRTQH